MRLRALAAAALVTIMSVPPPALAADPAPTSPEAQWSAWREKRARGLQREDGWLALVGLHWLTEGENRIAGLPGTWVLQGGKVRLAAAEGWTLDGAPAAARDLATDQAEKPDRLRNGTRQLAVIQRGPRFALRVWDAASPVRTAFKGLDTYPYDRRWRLEARWEPFATPKKVETPSVVGIPEPEQVPGRATFQIDGKTYSLEPTQEQPGEPLFFVFRDQTARTETYGAGRFLYTDPPKDGKVVLDFNRAYNPPCAFTPYATCPLPRPENVLAVRIDAGEKRFEH
jgi:uncharacterized protein (DUF1684 family)